MRARLWNLIRLLLAGVVVLLFLCSVALLLVSYVAPSRFTAGSTATEADDQGRIRKSWKVFAAHVSCSGGGLHLEVWSQASTPTGPGIESDWGWRRTPLNGRYVKLGGDDWIGWEHAPAAAADDYNRYWAAAPIPLVAGVLAIAPLVLLIRALRRRGLRGFPVELADGSEAHAAGEQG